MMTRLAVRRALVAPCLFAKHRCPRVGAFLCAPREDAPWESAPWEGALRERTGLVGAGAAGEDRRGRAWDLSSCF